LGVPRLKELLDVAKSMKIPSLTIFLKPVFQHKADAVLSFAKSLERTCLEDVVVEADVLWEPDLFKTSKIEDQEMLNLSKPFFTNQNPAFSSWVIRICLHKHLLLTRNYTSLHVIDAIQSFAGEKAYVWFTPPENDKWIIRVRLSDVKDMVEKLDAARRKQTERNLTYALQNLLMKNVIIGGIKDIESATPREINVSHVNDVTGEITKKKEWVIDTEGSVLGSIGILPAIDWRKTYSNDIIEIYEVLGLEAAVQVLFNEIKNVLSFDGSTINDRHIMMIVNTMTYRGSLMAFNRFGFNRQDDASVLGRSSFEEPMEILLEGAVFGQHDALRGVSERIMVGRRADMGTNSFERKGANGNIVRYAQRPTPPWRTRVTASWIPWEKKEPSLNENKLDSPPSSPLLRAMDTTNKPAVSDRKTQVNPDNIQKPYQNLTDNHVFTPTVRGKGVPITKEGISPTISPMIPSLRGYQLDQSYFSIQQHHQPPSSTQPRVIIPYRPSSPDMSSDENGNMFVPLYKMPKTVLNSNSEKSKIPRSLPPYKPSSPNIHEDTEDSCLNNGGTLSSEQISNLLNSLVKTGILDNSEPIEDVPEKKDIDRLMQNLNVHIQEQIVSLKPVSEEVSPHKGNFPPPPIITHGGTNHTTEQNTPMDWD